MVATINVVNYDRKR